MIEAMTTLVTATALLLGSPGPAPLALAGTGATFGVRGGLPFLGGILTGLSVAIVGATAGLAALFGIYPNARLTVQAISGLYIAYVALKIATAPVTSHSEASARLAPRFIDGFVLNLLNPKAYAAFLAIFSQFLLPLSSNAWAHVVTGMVCLAVATVVDFVWLCFGGAIAPLFRQPVQARILRVSFALLMVAAVVWAIMR